MANVLITGISGFVGKHTAREILRENTHKVTGLIRPNTAPERIEEFKDEVEFVEIDLCDINSLKKWVVKQDFDVIVHIGALRGGRPDSRDKYYLANVEATIIFANYCLDNDKKFIFCSSVGVFGAIPVSLPANDSSPRQDDNYYHFTKIRCEAIIEELVRRGLKAVIIRPAITYGVGDFGFPFSLCKLVSKKMMLLPNENVMIHLTNVNVLAQAFAYFVDAGFISGSRYIVADKKPVSLKELVNFISLELHNKKYPKTRTVPKALFSIGEKIARMANNELFVSRFELISKSWYYDLEATYSDIPVDPVDSLEHFQVVTDWFKEIK